MIKRPDGTYDCTNDINCSDKALQKCTRFRSVGKSYWCRLCDNHDACLDIWKHKIDALKTAELMGARHALNPHALYF